MMRIGLAQLNSTDDINKNLQSITDLITRAHSEKADLLLFPENSLYFRMNDSEKIKALSIQDPVFLKLEQLASETKVAIHLTTALLEEDQKVYNATVFIEPGKKTKIIYKKIHLFDIALVNQKPIRESDVFGSGTETSVFEYKGFKFGNSICYDIRFSELYKKYAEAEVDVILIPAAFLVKTGLAHWHILLRARAIESQCYVLAAAQAGVHKSAHTPHQRETFGHSLAVSPWGDVIATLEDGVGVIYLNIERSEVEKVRTQIPMKKHRKL